MELTIAGTPHPPLTTDEVGWQKGVFHDRGYVSIQRMDGPSFGLPIRSTRAPTFDTGKRIPTCEDRSAPVGRRNSRSTSLRRKYSSLRVRTTPNPPQSRSKRITFVILGGPTRDIGFCVPGLRFHTSERAPGQLGLSSPLLILTGRAIPGAASDGESGVTRPVFWEVRRWLGHGITPVLTTARKVLAMP